VFQIRLSTNIRHERYEFVFPVFGISQKDYLIRVADNGKCYLTRLD
jgi:hypothetical protein